VFAFLCVVGSYDAIADPTPDRFNIGRIAAAESVAAQEKVFLREIAPRVMGHMAKVSGATRPWPAVAEA
jgi:hypothetical protein